MLDEYRDAEWTAVSAESFGHFADSIKALALASGWPPRELQSVVHSAWAMEHGMATLILAQMVPQRDSGLERASMIGFAIDMLLSAVVAGPSGLKHVRLPRRAKRSRERALTDPTRRFSLGAMIVVVATIKIKPGTSAAFVAIASASPLP